MRLAIVIEGSQNSGKTSTIKNLVNCYGNKNISQMKRGWQRIFLNNSFQYLKLNFYCVPASPSETGIELKKRFNNIWIPEVIIVALQPNGKHYSSSNVFLTNNNYSILRYRINNSNGNSDWDRFNNNTKVRKLNNRANQIIGDIRQFINNNNLI